jgi:fused signal recognition particle receptor
MSGWVSKFTNIFSSTNKFSEGIKSIFSDKKIDDNILNDLRDLLISADFGVDTSNKIIDCIKDNKLSGNEIKDQALSIIEGIITEILSKAVKPFNIIKGQLNIILLVGVNGSGKTTTIGKLAAKYISQGLKVKIAACDTFRAAASEQMKIWSDRANAQIITQENKGDAASVAYRAISQSKEDGTDILFIDSAGRLQNNKNLMNELEKIVRVIKKLDNNAPHHSILVLDGTSGQNTISQCKHFSEAASINGLIITKLDGTARAGTIVNLTEQFKLPIYFIGVGEKLEDLKEFESKEYAESLFKR